MTHRTGTDGSAEPLDRAYDTALLDLDGVVYAGGEAIAHAVDSLEEARGHGMHLAYVTNNASRTPETVAEHLSRLGVPARAEDVITSAQAVARLIADQVPAGSKVLAVGGEGLFTALRERGLVPVESAEDGRRQRCRGTGRRCGGRNSPRCLRGEPRGAVVRVQHGSDDSQRAGDRAGQRRGGGGGEVRHWRHAAGGRQAAAADAPRDGAEDRRAAAVGGRGPARHRYRGCVRGRSGLAAGADGSDRRGRADRRVRAAPADLCGPGSAGLAGGAHRGRAGGGHGDVRRVDGVGHGWLRAGASDVGASDAGGALAVEGEGDPLDGLRALCAVAWARAGEDSGGLDADKAVARLGL